MASNQGEAKLENESLASVLKSTASQGKPKRPRRRGGKGRQKQRQSSTLSMSEQSKTSTSITAAIKATATTAKPELQPQLPTKQQDPTANKIKGYAGCKSNGEIDSTKGGNSNNNKGKGPTNITNTGLNINSDSNGKPQEPSKRNIILYTNRAKLTAQAELLAEAVPFRMPYNSA